MINQGVTRSPVFNQAVQRAAYGMLQQAIRSGKLRVAPQHTITGAFVPRMVLLEDTSCHKLTAVFELPGVKTGDITLQIRGGNLIVAGERKPPAQLALALGSGSAPLPRNPIAAADDMAAGEAMEEDNHPTIHIATHELRFGSFHRSIPVPEGLKESDVTAALQDGLLTVTWPKTTDRVVNLNQSLSGLGTTTTAHAAQ
ncbi:HSP20-like chaperone [Coprinopsis sp. MPI-PUGE-AT-0042]|nr:HSP20-like chaperone [Coprinopsis sp. MPI-PUGE-AT-0042]